MSDCGRGNHYNTNKNSGMTIVESSPKAIYEDTYYHYLEWASLIAMNMFRWNNLPNSMSERYLEETYFFMGCAGIVDLTGLASMGLVNPYELPAIYNSRIAPGGELLAYNDYSHYNAYFNNGDTYIVPNEWCVFGRNNYFRTPTCQYVEYYARKIAKIEMTIDQNVDAQKTQFIVKTTDAQKLTMTNLYKKYRDFEDIIIVDKNLDAENSLFVLPTKAEYVADDLFDLKTRYINELMTFLGINNANTSKRERVITSETDSNNELINLSAETMLNSRRQACEEANRKFGLNISCELREINLRPEYLDGNLIRNGKVIEDSVEIDI